MIEDIRFMIGARYHSDTVILSEVLPVGALAKRSIPVHPARMIPWIIVAVVVTGAALYAWTIVLTQRSWKRDETALALLPTIASAIGLDHDEEGLPESELQSFFFVIHRRSDPQFGGDSVEQVLRGTFEGVPIVSFAYWHDWDDTFHNEMCHTAPLSMTSPPIVVAVTLGRPFLDLPSIPVRALADTHAGAYGRDEELVTGLVESSIDTLLGRDGESGDSALPSYFEAAGHHVLTSSPLPRTAEEASAQLRTLLALRRLTIRALEASGSG